MSFLCVSVIALFASNLTFVLGFSSTLPSSSVSSITTTLSSPSIRHQASNPSSIHTSLFSSSSDSDSEQDQDNGIDISQDDRLYRIRLPRAPGIEWGTDLSFSFVYVREMEPAGPASLSDIVQKGDQICELRPVSSEKNESIPLIGASFDAVMNAFATLDPKVKDVDLVFFKGTKDELKKLCTADDGKSKQNDGMITITVIQNKGASDEKVIILKAKEGANIRQTLVDNGINVYQSVTRWTNCKGKQLCGTCIVNIAEGSVNTNRKR